MIEKKDPDLIGPYLADASNYRGYAEEVIIPESIEELRRITRNCYESNKLITISGGGTGLTGGRSPMGGIVISTERINRINSVNKASKRLNVESGAIISDIIRTASDAGLLYPPDPTETNSSIGGNAANNASGAKTFKYGATRKYIDYARIILPDGDIFSAGRGEYIADGSNLELKTESGKTIDILLPKLNMPDIKHAAGYYIRENMDALDLFIGSEGTLGIFAELGLRLIDKPDRVFGGIAFFDSYNGLFAFVDELREISRKHNSADYRINNCIAARLMELYDESALDLIKDDYPQLPDAVAAIWFEQEYSEENEDAILMKWNELIEKHTLLSDATWVALADSEHENLRRFRHAIPLKVNEINTIRSQKKIGTDIAVSDQYIYDLYMFTLEKIKQSGLDYAIWGHIGNSHLHANVFAGNDEEARGYRFYDQCIDKAISYGGTVSAEHGIGKIKKKYLSRMFSREEIAGMRKIKDLFDPYNILGRGNLFD